MTTRWPGMPSLPGIAGTRHPPGRRSLTPGPSTSTSSALDPERACAGEDPLPRRGGSELAGSSRIEKDLAARLADLCPPAAKGGHPPKRRVRVPIHPCPGEFWATAKSRLRGSGAGSQVVCGFVARRGWRHGRRGVSRRVVLSGRRSWVRRGRERCQPSRPRSAGRLSGGRNRVFVVTFDPDFLQRRLDVLGPIRGAAGERLDRGREVVQEPRLLRGQRLLEVAPARREPGPGSPRGCRCCCWRARRRIAPPRVRPGSGLCC